MTEGRGVDTAIEAVGLGTTFELCQELVAPGGVIANVGVHGHKADLHLETLWSHTIAVTMRLVDTETLPMLLKTVVAGTIDPTRLITHRFGFDEIAGAYDVFGRAADTKALKVIIAAQWRYATRSVAAGGLRVSASPIAWTRSAPLNGFSIATARGRSFATVAKSPLINTCGT